ncbi:MAG: adenylate/guanylate cyclase domain-containing protein [Syntrophales bacterium]
MPDESTLHGAQPLERRLATILCADVAGYSKMMADDEERTVRVFRGHREIFESLVSLHRGRIFNTAGDALLAEFNSAVEAVRCATEIQAALRTRNDHLPPEERMQFRMGINLGDVIIQGGDLLGDGVNVAARIQTATAPGGICISGSVHDQIQNKLSLNFKLLGEQTYKNIAKPVRTYTIDEGAAVTTSAHRTGWRLSAAIAAAVLAIAGVGTWGYRQYGVHRAEQLRIDAGLAAQLTAQKQATEQARLAAEEARREAQKLAGEEGLRRAQEERNRVEQDRKQLEAERRAAEAAKRQAAEEALRHAQERAQLDQERKRLEAEKLAAEAAKKQADASQRAVSPAAKEAPILAAPHDGAYRGRLCNQFPNKAPVCWPVALVVSNGIIEGSWISKTKKTSRARGTVAADGAVTLNLAAWTASGSPDVAPLLGRITDGTITASGQWRTGSGIAGDWKRMQIVAAEPAAKDAMTFAASHNGTYAGQLCNQLPDKAPACWPVALVVLNGIAEGSWIHPTKKAAWARGTVAAEGSVRLNLESWTPSGSPAGASLIGRIADGMITASGRWGHGGGVAGDWKRMP